MANSRSGDAMIDRVLRILGAFDAEHRDLAPSEVARRASIPRSTGHRIVRDLVAAGLLERDADGRVRIGMRLWELTTRGSRALALRQAALPHMERVQRSTGEHTQLGVLDQDAVLVIERLSSPSAGSNVATVAGRLPLHASSSGLVLLAFGRAALRERVLGGPLPQVAPGTITEPAALRRRLARIRTEGFAVLPGSIESVSTGISVPVLDRSGATVAALSAVVPAGWARERETIAELRAAALAISAAIADYGILTH